MNRSTIVYLIGAILAWSLGAEAMEPPAPPGEGTAPAFAAEARSKIATVLAAEEFGHTETTTSLRVRKPEADQAQGGWMAGLYAASCAEARRSWPRSARRSCGSPRRSRFS